MYSVWFLFLWNFRYFTHTIPPPPLLIFRFTSARDAHVTVKGKGKWNGGTRDKHSQFLLLNISIWKQSFIDIVLFFTSILLLTSSDDITTRHSSLTLVTISNSYLLIICNLSCWLPVVVLSNIVLLYRQLPVYISGHEHPFQLFPLTSFPLNTSPLLHLPSHRQITVLFFRFICFGFISVIEYHRHPFVAVFDFLNYFPIHAMITDDKSPVPQGMLQ